MTSSPFIILTMVWLEDRLLWQCQASWCCTAALTTTDMSWSQPRHTLILLPLFHSPGLAHPLEEPGPLQLLPLCGVVCVLADDCPEMLAKKVYVRATNLNFPVITVLKEAESVLRGYIAGWFQEA
jgi:hypothetical protein